MAKARRTFTTEFKVQAVQLVTEQGKSVAEVARDLDLSESLLRGWKTAYKMMQEFAPLRKQFRGRHLWARGCFCCSSGNVTDQVIAEYIANRDKPGDGDFRVEHGDF